MNVLLISTYELGRQPFGLASQAAWLRRDGHNVTCVDCAVETLPSDTIREADVIAFYLPMHTATRLATQLVPRVQELNPAAHLCFYGLYAPVNDSLLKELGADSILGGEFEEGLVRLCNRLSPQKKHSSNNGGNGKPRSVISLNKQQFITPERADLPNLSQYAMLCANGDEEKTVGYTEATRGCKHLCRHCPVVPVYDGQFRIVQREVVLADIRQQVAAGAEHITFGDPDFFNGPGHVLPIIEQLHREFPDLTYDVTIKIEHLLKHAHHLPTLKETGCAIVTSAVESIDEDVLRIFDKGHTREDFIRAVKLLDETELALNPTFIPFTPWTTLSAYRDLLQLLAELNLTEHVAPVQLGIRLLIPEGSKLLELDEIRDLIGGFNEGMLSYEWHNPDPRVEELQQAVMERVNSGNREQASRREIFTNIWAEVNSRLQNEIPLPKFPSGRKRATIPYLNEPWYC